MRKIFTGLFMSLDGVIDADDDWQFAYFDEELFASISAGMARVDAVLMGRRSFEGYAELRTAHPESPMVDFLERVDRYVASTTLTETDWRGTEVLTGDVKTKVTQLKQSPGRDILVAGSPSLVRWLLSHALLDELSVSILPVIVGPGARLFPDSSPSSSMTRTGLGLTSAKVLGSGVLQVSYKPASN